MKIFKSLVLTHSIKASWVNWTGCSIPDEILNALNPKEQNLLMKVGCLNKAKTINKELMVPNLLK